MPSRPAFKKILFIFLLFVVVTAAVYLVYYFFFRQSMSIDTGTNEAAVSPKKTQILFPLSKGPVLGASIDASGKKVKYYDKATGNIFSVALNGSDLSTLSSASLSGLVKAFWSPDKEKVISYFEDDKQTKKYLHNYSSGQSTLLNTEIKQAIWSPDSKKIASLTYDENSATSAVSIANADGSDFKIIFQTRIKDISLEWSAVDKISIITKPSGLAEGAVIFLNQENGDFTTALSGLFGLNAKWSPLGNILLYSATSESGKNPVLSYSNQFGQNKTSLGISTLADKCSFSQDNRFLFCAIPERISENAVWPDDYYKGMIATNDSFYKINIETGQKNLLLAVDAEKSYDASEIFLSPEEDYLIFINRRDGLLYSLKIK